MKQVILESFLKSYKYVSRITATSKMELYVALVISFQPLTNSTMNLSIVATGILNASLDYYNVLSNL